jgi:hypothetical protein
LYSIIKNFSKIIFGNGIKKWRHDWIADEVGMGEWIDGSGVGYLNSKMSEGIFIIGGT